jgi:hypothetical protein
MYVEVPMDRSQSATSWAAFILLWLARVWAVGAALILTAFFVEHLTWFRDPSQWPPLSVFLAQAFHLLLIVGLLMGWRWEVSGAGATLVGAAGFFIAAGAEWRVLPFLGATCFPALLWPGHVWLSRWGAEQQAHE